jgi:hypothetical protein
VVPAVHATRRRAAMLDEPTTKRRSPCAISHSKDRVRRDDGTEDARRNARGVPRRTPGNRRRSRVAQGARPHARRLLRRRGATRPAHLALRSGMARSLRA